MPLFCCQGWYWKRDMEGGLLQEFNFRHVMLTLLLDIQLQMLMVNNCTFSLALRETGFGAMISLVTSVGATLCSSVPFYPLPRLYLLLVITVIFPSRLSVTICAVFQKIWVFNMEFSWYIYKMLNLQWLLRTLRIKLQLVRLTLKILDIVRFLLVSFNLLNPLGSHYVAILIFHTLEFVSF